MFCKNQPMLSKVSNPKSQGSTQLTQSYSIQHLFSRHMKQSLEWTCASDGSVIWQASKRWKFFYALVLLNLPSNQQRVWAHSGKIFWLRKSRCVKLDHHIFRSEYSITLFPVYCFSFFMSCIFCVVPCLILTLCSVHLTLFFFFQYPGNIYGRIWKQKLGFVAAKWMRGSCGDGGWGVEWSENACFFIMFRISQTLG